MQVLRKLMHKAEATEWGREHGFGAVMSYEQFAATSPVNTYEDLKHFIDRMRQGEADVLDRKSVV